MNAKNLKTIAFFDGRCSLCSKEIRFFKKLDATKRIEWIDINEDVELLHALGITYEQAMLRMHVLDKRGILRRGAHAFLALWSELPYFKVIASLVYLSRTSYLLDKAYNEFADWRFKKRSGAQDGAAVACALPGQHDLPGRHELT
jgi:predicted DCC family thiol-disulfide oxidoreductase YuxK